MKKYSWCALTFFMSFVIWSQQQAELLVAVDTTSVRIGEQLNYTLQIKAYSLAQVQFPEQPIFAPFELLEESPIDTLSTISLSVHKNMP